MKGAYFMKQKFKYKSTTQFLSKPKTKKQYANMLRVLYGRKKDRGHIKKEYFRLLRQERKAYNELAQVFTKQYSQFYLGDYFF